MLLEISKEGTLTNTHIMTGFFDRIYFTPLLYGKLLYTFGGDRETCVSTAITIVNLERDKMIIMPAKMELARARAQPMVSLNNDWVAVWGGHDKYKGVSFVTSLEIFNLKEGTHAEMDVPILNKDYPVDYLSMIVD